MPTIVHRLCVFVVACVLGCASAHADDPTPLGFEDESIGSPGATWFVTTPGWAAALSERAKHAGERGALLSPKGEAAGFGNLLRSLDAAPYRGKRIAFRSMVRVEGNGRVQPWLRVDRPANVRGAFDNMQDRPIMPGAWTAATIEVDVDADATGMVVGFMAMGAVQASIDDVTLAIVGEALGSQPPSPPLPLTGDALENVRAAAKLVSCLRFFHPTDALRAIEDWGPVAITVIEAAEPASDAADLARRLSGAIAELAPGIDLWVRTDGSTGPEPRPMPEGATAAVAWKHFGAGRIGGATNPIYRSVLERVELVPDMSIVGVTADVPLGRQVMARIPVRVYADAKETLPHGTVPAAFAPGVRRPALSPLNRSTRLAAVALAWGVFQHFYPYFDVVATDWDAALSTALATAATDADGGAFLATLERLVAALHDGHGSVSWADQPAAPRLPLRLEWCGGQLLVIGTCGDAASRVSIGDEVRAIGDHSVDEWQKQAAERISAATDGWLRSRSAEFIATHLAAMGASMGPAPAPVALQLRSPDGTEYGAVVTPTNECFPADATRTRPAAGSEVAPGIRYFNLDGSETAALLAVLPQLAAAEGIVFDLRGYPGQAAYDLMERLIETPSQSARWNVPIVTRPDRVNLAWLESGRWNLVPRPPKLPKNVAFLTDGRAISYAESIMGIVEAYRLGAIVGSTTAGTNGNVNPFVVPGGYSIAWTGMRVLKHDGSTHHGVGIAPTLPVTPTAKGLAAGRDEVLEAAVELLSKGRAAAPR